MVKMLIRTSLYDQTLDEHILDLDNIVFDNNVDEQFSCEEHDGEKDDRNDFIRRLNEKEIYLFI